MGSNGQLRDMQMQFSMTMDGDALGAPGESLEMAYDIDVTVNAVGDAVTVDFPANLDSFPEAPTEAPADVDSTTAA